MQKWLSHLPYDLTAGKGRHVLCHNLSLAIFDALIDLLDILQKSPDLALFLYHFIREIRLSGVRASITSVHIRKFYRM